MDPLLVHIPPFELDRENQRRHAIVQRRMRSAWQRPSSNRQRRSRPPRV